MSDRSTPSITMIARVVCHASHSPIAVEGEMTWFRVWLLVMLLLSAATDDSEPAQSKRVLRVAAVITPESSGLLQQLGAEFEKQTGTSVHVDSRQDVFGLARDGKVDLVIAHYGHRGIEDFFADDLGAWPRPVFSNQAALIGPSSDPARISAAGDAVEAFRRIAESRSPFVVNNSQTEKYLAEILWQAAGKPDRTGWYRDKGLRNQAETKDAIRAAVEEKGYTLWGL